MTAPKRTEFGSANKSERARISEKGRVCQMTGCSTVLSIYNGLDVCSEHEVPRRRPATYNR
jgi:hypothetical protein